MDKPPEECEHEWVFHHTYADWFDGDEDDVYVCLKCGKHKTVYAPR